MGTNLSAGLCEECAGPVLPVDSSLDCQQWSCSQCGLARDRQDVINIVRQLEEEMFNTEEHEYDKYCTMLDKFSPLLHPNHYQLLICKRYLANSIRGNISLEMAEVRFCCSTIILIILLFYAEKDPADGGVHQGLPGG